MLVVQFPVMHPLVIETVSYGGLIAVACAIVVVGAIVSLRVSIVAKQTEHKPRSHKAVSDASSAMPDAPAPSRPEAASEGAHTGRVASGGAAADAVVACDDGEMASDEESDSEGTGAKDGDSNSGSGKKSEQGEDEEAEPVARLSRLDVMLFPVTGSIMLVGLYLLLRYVNKARVLVTLFFSVLGFSAFVHNGAPILENLLPSLERAIHIPRTLRHGAVGRVLKPVIRFLAPPPHHLAWADVACGLLGAGLSVASLLTKHWLLNDIFAIAFSLELFATLLLPCAPYGTVLLCGLFFYDIFWVFGTDVMITVAKGLDAPIKLVLPRLFSREVALLGMGDVLVPGLFIAMLLRFDFASGSRRPTMFRAALVAYAISLVVTVGVLLGFRAHQPALLYIVPFQLLTAVCCAAVTGRFRALWSWDERAAEDAEALGWVVGHSPSCDEAHESSSDICASDNVTWPTVASVWKWIMSSGARRPSGDT